MHTDTIIPGSAPIATMYFLLQCAGEEIVKREIINQKETYQPYPFGKFSKAIPTAYAIMIDTQICKLIIQYCSLIEKW